MCLFNYFFKYLLSCVRLLIKLDLRLGILSKRMSEDDRLDLHSNPSSPFH